MMRERLYTAVVCDALDAVGRRRQSPAVQLRPLTAERLLVGRCKTTLWDDLYHEDPCPYELELKAVDTCAADDVLIAACNGSLRSAVWGELLTTAAANRGCVGAVVDGAVRDVGRMRQMGFTVFARGMSPHDSRNRQRVVDIDVPVEIGGVVFHTGELVFADIDGIVVVPRDVEEDVLRLAWAKVHAESTVRDAIRDGMSATAAFEKYGIL
jgi:regulator of RNase E activity RraA